MAVTQRVKNLKTGECAINEPVVFVCILSFVICFCCIGFVSMKKYKKKILRKENEMFSQEFGGISTNALIAHRRTSI
jgi:hypothetical protein